MALYVKRDVGIQLNYGAGSVVAQGDVVDFHVGLVFRENPAIFNKTYTLAGGDIQANATGWLLSIPKTDILVAGVYHMTADSIDAGPNTVGWDISEADVTFQLQ